MGVDEQQIITVEFTRFVRAHPSFIVDFEAERPVKFGFFLRSKVLWKVNEYETDRCAMGGGPFLPLIR